MMKKKLKLHRMTIANLTGPRTAQVVGGAAGPTQGAGIQSEKIDTRVYPCEVATGDCCYFLTSTPT